MHKKWITIWKPPYCRTLKRRFMHRQNKISLLWSRARWSLKIRQALPHLRAMRTINGHSGQVFSRKDQLLLPNKNALLLKKTALLLSTIIIAAFTDKNNQWTGTIFLIFKPNGKRRLMIKTVIVMSVSFTKSLFANNKYHYLIDNIMLSNIKSSLQLLAYP